MQNKWDVITNEVSDVFNKAYEKILHHLMTKESPEIEDAVNWLKKAIEYNVLNGKKLRGMMVVSAFKQFAPKEKINEKSIELSCIVGWCIEFLHTAYVINDDMMDHSLKRRGKTCWYLVENVGRMAVNDATLVYLALFELLRHYASEDECYQEIVDIFLERSYKISLGQCIDGLTTPEGCRPNFPLLTSERCTAIRKYKTAYASFDQPVRAALYLAGIKDKKIHNESEKILIRLGHFFQIQDDFLDFNGDPNVMGKIGTDIEDGKCSWITAEAVKLMSAEEYELFCKHYGYKDETNANIIRALYKKLNVENVFYAWENKEYVELSNEIEKFGINTKVATKPFRTVLEILYKRDK